MIPAFPFERLAVRVSAIDELPGEWGDEDFIRLCTSMPLDAPRCLLLSGGAIEDGRYSIHASRPLLVFERRAGVNSLSIGGGRHTVASDPFTALDGLTATIDAVRPMDSPYSCPGLFGYLAYECKNSIERLPQSARDPLRLPEILLLLPSVTHIHDRLHGTVARIEYEIEGLNPIPFFSSTTQHLAPGDGFGPSPPLSREEYIRMVGRIREHIRNGDVYQVNLTHRLAYPFTGDPQGLFIELYRDNPAPYYAFIDAGDHQVVSTSMELFLLRNKGVLRSRPVKGTRPRGKTATEDARLRDELMTSPKDDAELSMIVDLVRNDLGRIALPGTVAVLDHKRFDAYRNVFHLSSTVACRLPDDASHGAVLRAAFPAGSITGCPKIRAMEIIDACESTVRHVYTGAIGYLGFDRSMHLSVAIRTALIAGGYCLFGTGGGLVYDSDPSAEYEETLHKAAAYLDVLSRHAEPAQ